MSIDGEPVDDDDARRAAATRLQLVERSVGIEASYFEILTSRSRSAGSPTRRSTSRSSRSAWAARGTRRTSSTGEVAVVTNVARRPRRVPRADARADRDREGRHREARLDARARRDRSEAAGDLRRARDARVSCCDANVDFGVRRNVLAVGGRLVDLYTSRRRVPRRVPPAARRAPGRQRGDRARGRRGVRRGAAPVRGRGRRARARRVAGPARGGRPPAARRARRRAQRRGRGGVAPGARRGVRRVEARVPSSSGFLREKDPHEMLDGARRRRARRRRRALVVRARRPPSPRALAPDVVAKAALDLGVPRRPHRGRRHRRRRASAPRCSPRREDGPDRGHRLALRRRRRPHPSCVRDRSERRPADSQNALVSDGEGRGASGSTGSGRRICFAAARVDGARELAAVCDIDAARAEKAATDSRGARVHRRGTSCSRAARSTRSSSRRRRARTASSCATRSTPGCTCTARSRSRRRATRATRSPRTRATRERVLQVGFQFRFHKGYAALRDAVRGDRPAAARARDRDELVPRPAVLPTRARGGRRGAWPAAGC